MFDIISYCCIFLPLFLYPIPYLNTSLISQPVFIRISELRVFLLIMNNFVYVKSIYNDFFSNNTFFIIFGSLLLTIGQIFNVSVYNILGEKGVYYGLQYNTVEKKIIKGFPFIINHPLYIGGILSYLGIYLMVGYKNDCFDPFLTLQLICILIVQIYLMIMESYLDTISRSREIPKSIEFNDKGIIIR